MMQEQGQEQMACKARNHWRCVETAEFHAPLIAPGLYAAPLAQGPPSGPIPGTTGTTTRRPRGAAREACTMKLMTRVARRGDHDHVTVWGDSRAIGQLTVGAGEGHELATQLRLSEPAGPLEQNPHRCSDGGCVLLVPGAPVGASTNGGCKCLHSPTGYESVRVRKGIAWLAARADARVRTTVSLDSTSALVTPERVAAALTTAMAASESNSRFDMYTRYEHLPEQLRGYSRPFCDAARQIWAERGAAHMPEAAVAVCFGIGQSTPWATAADPAEAAEAHELLRKAYRQAAHPGTWSDERMVARLVRTIIQAKDAWVRANLPG